MGCLEMTFDDYFRLVDATGRQVRRDTTGAIPADVASILDRLRISGES